MRELALFRRVARREARRGTGRHPDFPTAHAAQAQAGAYEGDVLALPESTDNLFAYQAADGTLYFLAGFDRVGDPNHPVGPG
jgi:hypothetical protein